jgi:hypothetical protein
LRGSLFFENFFFQLFLVSRGSEIGAFGTWFTFITGLPGIGRQFFVSTLGEEVGVIVAKFALGRVLRLFFDHIESSLLVIFIEVVSLSTYETAFLLKESLILIIHL